MDLFVTFGSYILIAILIFGLIALFIRVFTTVFKK